MKPMTRIALLCVLAVSLATGAWTAPAWGGGACPSPVGDTIGPGQMWKVPGCASGYNTSVLVKCIQADTFTWGPHHDRKSKQVCAFDFTSGTTFTVHLKVGQTYSTGHGLDWIRGWVGVIEVIDAKGF